MRKIYKYRVAGEPWKGPQIRKILSVAYQNEEMVVWCEVETDAPEVMHRWVFYPTGAAPTGEYTCSIGQIYNNLIWHLYHIQRNEVSEKGAYETDAVFEFLNPKDSIIF